MGIFTVSVYELVGEGFDFGLDNYPIFEESYRSELNSRILDHFMFYEIGQETREQFRFVLNRKMREIMPYYNQLYLSTRLIADDPLSTFRVQTESTNISDSNRTSTETGSHSTTADSKNSARTVESQFPQTMLSDNGDYATAASDTVSEGRTATEGDSSAEALSTDKMTGTVSSRTAGHQGHVALLLSQFRDTFLNVDLMVFNELVSVFMLVTDDGSAYTERNVGYGSPYGTTYPL